MKQPLFTGVCTAIVTPFSETGIDFTLLDRLLDRQLAARVSAIVLAGTTGECATLSDEEKLALLQHALRYVQGRCKILLGTGSNCTAHAVHMSRMAEAYGADGVLVVTPYYNKTTQDGLVAHYLQIADRIKLPMILYNVPSRTGMQISYDSYCRLAAHPNINGTKEASYDLALISRLRLDCADSLHVWAGNDEQCAPMMALGAQGVISTVSNLVPEKMVALTGACLSNDFARAGRMQNELIPLIGAVFSEVNPIPAKTALRLMGYPVGCCRPPLSEMQEETCQKLQAVLAAQGLLPENAVS